MSRGRRRVGSPLGAHLALCCRTVRWLRAADTLVVSPDATVVCLIHDAQAPAETAAALVALEKHTPIDVPVVVVGATREYDLGGASDRELMAVAGQFGSSLGGLVLEVERLATPADLVLLSSACRVPPRWLERLRAAALCDDMVATATPLSNSDDARVVARDGVDETDERIATSALRTRPRLLIGGPECVYVRRPALQLIGGVPAEQTTLGALTAALSEACLGTGMVNVLADDLFVGCTRRHAPSAELPGARLRNLDRADERSALQRALGVSRAALTGLSVTIDGRSLGPSHGGTQLYTLQLALALARSGSLAVRVVVGPDVSVDSHRRLTEADGIGLSPNQVIAGVEKSDIVHRPQQVFTADDLNLLALLGRRLVVTHQDLIAYHNPTYHSSFETWEQYRRITRIALAAADRIVFFRAQSARCGGRGSRQRSASRRRGCCPGRSVELPRGLPAACPWIVSSSSAWRPTTSTESPLCDRVGCGAARSTGLAGGARLGRSACRLRILRADEGQLLGNNASLRDVVIDVGAVDDEERRWLLVNARAVLVPSVVEGFGVVPLEAARAAQACLFAPQTSLREVLSSGLATLVPWDASASAHGPDHC